MKEIKFRTMKNPKSVSTKNILQNSNQKQLNPFRLQTEASQSQSIFS